MTKKIRTKTYLTVEEIIEITKRYGQEPSEDLCEEFGCTKSRLSQVATQMRAIGVNVSRMHKVGLFILAKEILAKTNPEMMVKGFRMGKEK